MVQSVGHGLICQQQIDAVSHDQELHCYITITTLHYVMLTNKHITINGSVK